MSQTAIRGFSVEALIADATMSLASDMRGATRLGMCIALPYSGSALNYEPSLVFSLILSVVAL